MLNISNLSFSYGNRLILNNIEFNINKSETVFLLGKNGAGKTTLFKCLLGINKGYKGNISVNNKDLKAYSQRALAREIAYIPQSNYPAFNYSVMDMVLMGTASSFSALSKPREEHINKAVSALEMTGIENLHNLMYMNLSGGERQLVIIARALAQDARLLFMDEPTSSLDYGNQIRVLATIKRLSNIGYTTVISCHNPQLALSFGSRVIALDNGKIVADGKPLEVISPALLKQLYNIDSEFKATDLGTVIIPR